MLRSPRRREFHRPAGQAAGPDSFLLYNARNFRRRGFFFIAFFIIVLKWLHRSLSSRPAPMFFFSGRSRRHRAEALRERGASEVVLTTGAHTARREEGRTKLVGRALPSRRNSYAFCFYILLGAKVTRQL